MYLALCVLLMTVCTFLTVLEHQSATTAPTDAPARKPWLPIVEGGLCAIGVLLYPILYLVLAGFLSTFREAFASWAWDCVTVYFRYALGTLGAFLLVTFGSATSAIVEKRYRSKQWRWMRSVCSLASSVVLLSIAGFFAATSATDELPLSSYIQAWGMAGVLVLRGMYVIEHLSRRRG